MGREFHKEGTTSAVAWSHTNACGASDPLLGRLEVAVRKRVGLFLILRPGAPGRHLSEVWRKEVTLRNGY